MTILRAVSLFASDFEGRFAETRENPFKRSIKL